VRAFAVLAETSLDDSAPGVTLQQLRALAVLHESGPRNATSLASALGIAPSTMTRLADRLVRTGLVRRATDQADRRAVVLSTTRRGVQTATRVKTRRLHELERRFDQLTAKQRATVHAALRAVSPLFDNEEETS
jgi:DNA-binding MarR family transcriptional regulator